MSEFEPVTFGYEWETLLVKPNLMPVDSKDVDYVAHRLREKFAWCRAGYDWVGGGMWKMLELRSGIMKSYKETEEKTRLQVDEVNKICNEKGWVFFPIGSHPAIGNAVGLHVHIGSIYKAKEATQLANSLARYAPCFAALAANSPVWGLEVGEYKSYRVLKYADWCSWVRQISNPEFAQLDFHADVCVKIESHPTIEWRIGDSASSIEFVMEYVGFVVAFVIGLLKRGIPEFNKVAYLESIDNRWRAAKLGLQAVFLWDGEKREVIDILRDMLWVADFKSIGCKELKLISKMLALRQTQADWQLLLHKYNKDSHSFAKSVSNAISRGEPFQEYLAIAPELPIGEYLSTDDYILQNIGIETPYRYLYASLLLPHFELQCRLKEFEKVGYIKVDNKPEEGALYSRNF